MAPRTTHMTTPCTTTSHHLPTVSVIQIPAVTVLQTRFDREHADNWCFPRKTKRKENIIWTERERAKAEAGEVVQDLDDLCSKLDKRYTDGCSKDTDTYLRIPMDVLGG
ncbi:hypothetical protein M405DRAFT_581175 [Rhizopogon salebrosus TDB-379]|nr:hypothetical protein M405DRAFT_581175 [Rhizopogon salebrosus TDB-379]